jgi:hypothetical protein
VVLLRAPSPADSAPQAPTARPQVALYGDSLTVDAWDRYAAGTAGGIDTDGHAFWGMTLPMWRGQIEQHPATRLVLALGTNDAQHDGAKPWAEVLDELPATTCVVWPKPYEGSNAVRLFNAQLTAILAAHPNVHEIDWNATAQPHPEWVQADHIHYTDAGRDAYAAVLEQAARTCP